MKPKAFTLIEALVCMAIVAILVALIIPAVHAARGRANGTLPAPVETSQSGCSLVTVQHDGHQYVIGRMSSGTAMLHSPSCPCQKKAERE